MNNLETALSLSEKGMEVFPLNPSGRPYTQNGFKDATSDVNLIQDAWTKHPDALIGVFTGGSGLVVLDLDVKVDESGTVLVDGFDSIAEAWLDIPDTFAYDSRNGLGRHIVYRAPEGVNLPRSMGYRGMKGVDRCSGLGYVAWMGGVPEEGEIVDAPEWLLDERAERTTHEYSGTLADWAKGLVPGSPNAVVRNAWSKAEAKFEKLGRDFSHSDMAELQFEAVRIACEGNPGALEYLYFLEELFLSREGSHSRPEELWTEEWEEALLSAIAKYGDMVPEFKEMPDYNIGLVPPGIPDSLVQNENGKAGFSSLLGALTQETEDDLRVASILWSCPATTELSHEWGFLFVLKRIAEARVKPEPTRENPRLEEKREEVEKGDDGNLDLLTAEEKEYLSSRPSFVQHIQSMASDLGYDQMGYFEAAAWNMASLAFGMKGFVPVSATQRHGVNLWQIVPGGSGTGKSVVDGLQTDVLDYVMYSEAEVPYDLGADSSIQGLHMALLQRDGVPSLFAADEASGWFKRLKVNDWATGLEDTLADWYMGRVSGSNKISLKELRGKSARTSFNLFMFATPDRLMETLTRDQFMSGFLARVMWTFGNPRQDSDEMFDIFKESSEEVEDASVAPSAIQGVSADLVSARSWFQEPVVLKPTTEAKRRMSDAYRKMYRTLQDKRNWDVIEPALTRHMESMLKAAGVCAMYRGDSKIDLDDALHAVRALEGWVKNLVQVADLVSAGDFQRRADELEAFLRQVGGTTSGAKIYHRFKNWIVRDSKEIENVITYLVQSGIINKDDSNGGIRYSLNGE